jgi:catechol 2,3-dioxygenase-like lactoylglutathione lyase family enzyme
MSTSEESVRNIVKRTTLMVRDMTIAKRWYEYVMGMSTYYDSEFILSGEGLAAGKAGDKTHLVMMKCEHPEIGMIGLLHWIDPPMPAPPVPTSITYGNPTFVVASKDVKLTHERALEMGTHVHSAPHEWSTRGANGKMKHFLGLSLFDPDGYFYEINQLVHEDD